MTISEFNSLNLNSQFDTILSWGYMMINSTIGHNTKSLFSLHGFFVELLINNKDLQILTIKSYQNEDLPLEYYRRIDHENPFTSAFLGDTGYLNELVATENGPVAVIV